MARQPELEQAAQPTLIGVHPEEGENGLVIQGRVRLKSKPNSEDSRTRIGRSPRRAFNLRALVLGNDYLEGPALAVFSGHSGNVLGADVSPRHELVDFSHGPAIDEA